MTRARLVTLVLVTGFAVGALMLAAAPVSAADAKGCQVTVESTDAQGDPLDTARAPGPGGTQDDPFTLDAAGSITYTARTDRPIRNGEWKVKTTIPGVAPTGDIGDSGEQVTEGTEELDQYLEPGGLFGAPLFTGLAKVDFVATGADGATCEVSGWIEIEGGVSIVLGVAIALVVIALLFFIFGVWPTEVADMSAFGP